MAGRNRFGEFVVGFNFSRTESGKQVERSDTMDYSVALSILEKALNQDLRKVCKKLKPKEKFNQNQVDALACCFHFVGPSKFDSNQELIDLVADGRYELAWDIIDQLLTESGAIRSHRAKVRNLFFEVDKYA